MLSELGVEEVGASGRRRCWLAVFIAAALTCPSPTHSITLLRATWPGTAHRCMYGNNAASEGGF